MYKLSTRYELNLTMGIKGHFGVESVFKNRVKLFLTLVQEGHVHYILHMNYYHKKCQYHREEFNIVSTFINFALFNKFKETTSS